MAPRIKKSVKDPRDQIINELLIRINNLEDRLHYDEQMMDELFIRIPKVIDVSRKLEDNNMDDYIVDEEEEFE